MEGTIENIDTFVLEREGYEFIGWGTAPDKNVSDFLTKILLLKMTLHYMLLWNKIICSPEPTSDVNPSRAKSPI